MDLREVGYDDRDWINLAQDRDRWRAYYHKSIRIYSPSGGTPAWLIRLRRLPAGLKLRSDAGSIPAWANYLVGFFSEVFPNCKVNPRLRRFYAFALETHLSSLSLTAYYGVRQERIKGEVYENKGKLVARIVNSVPLIKEEDNLSRAGIELLNYTDTM
ncbi:hypothetical protein ANN_08443 [Periplaneta americana]|uniref:Uncharacterized protein n=1 Tax=Periplaneta americana TaxID=6978 RepID=A0ABQ8T1F6_PERAM|nr:hypothetical protein ANN_08443 [Periplaneta americana]